MGRNIGRLTLAGALIIMGAALIADNVLHTAIAVYVGRLWPVLLILLGLEWITAAKRLEVGDKLRMDPAALVMLGVVALGMGSWSEAKLNQKGSSIDWSGPDIAPIVTVRPPSVTMPALPMIGNVSEQVESTYDSPIPDLKEIEVNDASAAIEVKSGSEFKVTLKATGYGSSQAEANENARSLKLRVTAGPTTRIVTDRLRSLNRMALAYEIEVPKGVSVKVRSSSGAVSVKEIDGSVDVTASSGRVEVEQVTGDASVSTSSGGVAIKEIRGNVRADANSGSIKIEQVGGSVSAQASSGAVEVATDQVGGAYDLTASSGSVKLSLPESASVDVTARASSGSVSGPGWLSPGDGRHSGSGKLGAGEHKVTIRTSSGSIQIDVD